MAINAGTCVGVLYYRQKNGIWTVGIHNGRTRNKVTATSKLLLSHVSNAAEFYQSNPSVLIFYKTYAEYLAALKKKPKEGTPFGVRITTKVTAAQSNHACVAFLQNVYEKNMTGSDITTKKVAHNGKFIEYKSPRGNVYTTVDAAIKSIQADPGGSLLYWHYNLVPRSGGRYELALQKAINSNIVALKYLK